MKKERFNELYLPELERKYKVFKNENSILVKGTKQGVLRYCIDKDIILIVNTGEWIKNGLKWLQKENIISDVVRTINEVEKIVITITKYPIKQKLTKKERKERLQNFIDNILPLICLNYEIDVRDKYKNCLIKNTPVGNLVYYPIGDKVQICRTMKWENNGLEYLRDKKVL